MKNLITFFFIFLSSALYSQRILIQENFENAGFNSDSLPTGWFALDADGTNSNDPFAKWKVRDSSATFPGVNPVLKSRAYNSRRSISIPWRAGDPVADDWIWTPIL
ncbi:MAG: hypothetical protein N2510_10130, partial [Ignavibacteria bacterium]|nr:hypothetical protein [Ignavibacteria bacterium]